MVNFPVPVPQQPHPPTGIYYHNQAEFYGQGTVTFTLDNSINSFSLHLDYIGLGVGFAYPDTDYYGLTLSVNVTVPAHSSVTLTVPFGGFFAGSNVIFGHYPPNDLLCGPASFLFQFEGLREWGTANTIVRSLSATFTDVYVEYEVVAGIQLCPDSGPCNCNNDCPPCPGGQSIGSGRCASVCLNSSSSSTFFSGWTITDANANVIASSDTPNGWSYGQLSLCSALVCAPCLPADQLALNHYQGPYTLTFGGGQPCFCDNQTKYKVYTATFTMTADVICPQEPPPKPGQTVSYDVSDSRRHVRAFSTLKADGVTPDKVHVGVAANVLPLDWKDVTTTIVAKRFCIRWDRRSLGSTLYGLAEGVDAQAGQVLLYQSIDEGNTWTFKFRVDEGTKPNTRPVLLISRDGRRFCFWFQKGAGTNGVIQQKVFDAAWNVSQPTSVKFPIAEDDDFNFDEYVGANGAWTLMPWYTESGTHRHPTGFVARDGRRFAYLNSGGQVSFSVIGGNDQSIQGTRVIANLGAVDDDQLAVDETVGPDGQWYVTLLYRSEGQILTKSSKDGIIFS
jgi:hypothetical protein